MNEFIINLITDEDILTIKMDGEKFRDREYILGTRYDDKAQKLIFIREEIYANDDLIIKFKNTKNIFPNINIGTGNEFIIGNEYTQYQLLSMQVEFRTQSGDLKISSDIIEFYYRKEIHQDGGIEPPPIPPDPVADLIDRAFVNSHYDYNDKTIVFDNLAGDEVVRVFIPSSGEGGGYTFFPSVSEDGVISWTNDGGYPNPPPVNIKGEDGKIQSIIGGKGIIIDNTDENNPVISLTSIPPIDGIESIVSGDGISIDNTDPKNPILSIDKSEVLDISSKQSITGEKEFYQYPVNTSIQRPDQNNQFVDKQYVDEAINDLTGSEWIEF